MDLSTLKLQLPDWNVPPEDTFQDFNLFQVLSLLELVFWGYVPMSAFKLELEAIDSISM